MVPAISEKAFSSITRESESSMTNPRLFFQIALTVLVSTVGCKTSDKSTASLSDDEPAVLTPAERHEAGLRSLTQAGARILPAAGGQVNIVLTGWNQPVEAYAALSQ